MTATALDRWPLVGRHGCLDQFSSALATEGASGVLVHGEAGVGKTRLSEECAALAERHGCTVLRAVASESAATLPLGALAHLLPAELVEQPAERSRRATLGGPDSIRVFESTRRAFADLGDGRVVLFVDELQLLDAASATLITQLIVDGAIFLLGAVRTGQVMPDAVTALWRDHGAIRIDLDNLSREGVDTLLHLALGGPIEGGAGLALWQASGGNVLYLRELVVGATERGDLVQEGGVWRLTGPLTASTRLSELVGARLLGLDDEARRVVEVVALCEPVGLPELEAITELSVLERLERDLLLEITTDRRRTTVRIAHPLQGELLREQLPAIRRRNILREQIDRIDAFGHRRREDARRVASWRLDLDGTADHELLVQAATVARYSHDFRHVARLARAAYDDEPSPQSALLLGEALYELGDFAEADRVLAEGWRQQSLEMASAGSIGSAEQADADRLSVQLTVIGTKNLLWGLLDPNEALALNERGRGLVSTDEARDELIADEAAILMFTGEPVGALRLLDDLAPADSLRGEVVRAIPRSPALSAVGRTAEAIAVAEQAFVTHSDLGDQLAIAHPGTHIVSQVFALTDAGRLAEAEQLAQAGYDITVADRALIAQIWFALNLGRIALIGGRMATARRWSQEGVALARATGFVGPLHLALAGLATASAGMGATSDATRAIDELDGLPGFGFLEPELAIGRGWALVATGDLVAGRARLLAGAEQAAASGHTVAESWLRHDIARLGDPAAATARLDELASATDSALVTARAHHARALATHDADQLTAAVDELAELLMPLAAAEAATSASEEWKKQGEQRRSAQMTDRAQQLLSMCEGATSPGVITTDSVVALSKREREVGLLAAQAVASKDIAERLFLSVRTVNNHLQRVYTKLGVTSRAELAEALARRGDDR